MTSYLPAEFSVTVQTADAQALHLAVHGDLDYDTSDDFTPTVARALDAHAERYGPTLRDLHLDWAELTAFDSSGLSALLGLHRRTHPAGITLHLHHQPVYLTRMLKVTGVTGHLTQHAPAADTAVPAEANGPTG
ncbi:STAS domain-containing protein [Streptomyces sp. MBT97]|uniref:STAS domain-containing protein n=1 Tax=Streptomyces sp. MBT97 TaxID=2800411 RepID=UPI00190B10AE|nr:STAS domain-containing protein [Streptomyces sp. MBT97]MBK3633488.1 STAS domain-containing protein [Streptomyces sp. MBT97]